MNISAELASAGWTGSKHPTVEEILLKLPRIFQREIKKHKDKTNTPPEIEPIARLWIKSQKNKSIYSLS